VFDSVQVYSRAIKEARVNQAPTASAEQLMDDGADKPFLDVYVESEERAFVVGAYNLIFRTEDGGKSWQPWRNRVENPKELHFYAMRRCGQDLFLVGEQDLCFDRQMME